MLKLFQVIFLYSNLFLIIFQDKGGKVPFTYKIFIYFISLFIFAFGNFSFYFLLFPQNLHFVLSVIQFFLII